jgi:hypothetical protein
MGIAENFLRGRGLAEQRGSQIDTAYSNLMAIQEEKKRYQEEQARQKATMQLDYSIRQLGDLDMRLGMDDDTAAKLLGSAKQAAGVLGVEVADPDPVPKALAKEFWTMKTDPVWRAKTPEERYRYLTTRYGRHWYQARQEFLDQNKISAMQAEQAEAEQGVAKRNQEKADATLAKGEGPVKTEFEQAPKGKTPYQMEAEALFGDAYDELSAEDMKLYSDMIDADPKKRMDLAALMSVTPQGRRVLKQIGLKYGLNTNVPDDRFTAEYMPGLLEGMQMEADEISSLNNQKAMASVYDQVRKDIERQANPIEVAQFYYPQVASIGYKGSPDAFAAWVQTIGPMTGYQEESIDARKRSQDFAETKFGIQTNQAQQRIDIQQFTAESMATDRAADNELANAREARLRSQQASGGAGVKPSASWFTIKDRLNKEIALFSGIINSGEITDADGTTRPATPGEKATYQQIVQSKQDILAEMEALTAGQVQAGGTSANLRTKFTSGTQSAIANRLRQYKKKGQMPSLQEFLNGAPKSYNRDELKKIYDYVATRG